MTELAVTVAYAPKTLRTERKGVAATSTKQKEIVKPLRYVNSQERGDSNGD